MNIAIVGGGKRGRAVLDLIENNTFQEIQPKVVALAEERPDAPAVIEARNKGIFVTADYNDLFDREDVDLIMDLTGDQNIFFDILAKKKKTVRAINHDTALLFWNFSTQQKKTNRQLVETKAMYDIMINQLIQEDVMIIGTDHRIMDINDTMLKKLGLAREDTIGKYCFEISHREVIPCSGENHPCPLENTMATRKPSKATHVHLDLDNNEHYISISCYPLFENGEIVAVAELCKDISDEINIHKAMQAQEKLASIGRLAAGVAHEINNPMTTILTSAMLLQEDTTPDSPLFDDLKTIVSETLRCRRIVTSLLDFARQSKAAKKRVSIQDTVNNCLVLTKKQAAFKDIAIVPKLTQDLPPVYIDKDQIQQAVINLLLNAIEATASGGNIVLKTKLADTKRSIHIIVSDNGEGIAAEHLNSIFDPFYTTKENGTGLGLAITHGIIEQNGGAMDVESVLGVGTIFTIILPVDQGDRHVA